VEVKRILQSISAKLKSMCADLTLCLFVCFYFWYDEVGASIVGPVFALRTRHES
jgi:hypothetical protein